MIKQIYLNTFVFHIPYVLCGEEQCLRRPVVYTSESISTSKFLRHSSNTDTHPFDICLNKLQVSVS